MAQDTLAAIDEGILIVDLLIIELDAIIDAGVSALPD